MALACWEFLCPEDKGRERVTGQWFPTGPGSCQLLSPTSTPPPWLVFYPGPGLYSLPNGTGVSGYAMEEGVHSALGAPRTVTGIGDLAGTP